MKEEQLIKELIKEGESDKLEFKEVMRLDSIAKTICSFLNTNGEIGRASWRERV